MPHCCPPWKFVEGNEVACKGISIMCLMLAIQWAWPLCSRLITLKVQIPVNNSYSCQTCQLMYHKLRDWRCQLTEELLHVLQGMETNNTDRLPGMAEWTKVRILRSGTYVQKSLGSTKWTVKVTPAAIRQLLYLPLLPLTPVSTVHTSVQWEQCVFSSLAVHLALWVAALHLTDK